MIKTSLSSGPNSNMSDYQLIEGTCDNLLTLVVRAFTRRNKMLLDNPQGLSGFGF